MRIRFSLKLLLLMIVPISTFFAGRTSLRIEQQIAENRVHAPNLRVPVIGTFENTHFRAVVEDFTRQANLEVEWDERGLMSQGAVRDKRVSIHLDCHISLKSALHLILSPLGLGYYVKNGKVIVTTGELADLARKTHARVRRIACGVPG